MQDHRLYKGIQYRWILQFSTLVLTPQNSISVDSIFVQHEGGKRCSFPDCSSGILTGYARQKGLCYAHGCYKLCKTTDCTNTSITEGHCYAVRIVLPKINQVWLTRFYFFSMEVVKNVRFKVVSQMRENMENVTSMSERRFALCRIATARLVTEGDAIVMEDIVFVLWTVVRDTPMN